MGVPPQDLAELFICSQISFSESFISSFGGVKKTQCE
jgi:hypothetical protein